MIDKIERIVNALDKNSHKTGSFESDAYTLGWISAIVGYGQDTDSDKSVPWYKI